MLRPLAFAIKTSFAKYFVIPLVAVGAVILFTRDNYWIGIWPETGATVSTVAFFLSLFASGGVAWAVARDRVSGVDELTRHASHRASVVGGLRFAGTYFWIMLSFVVAVSVVAVITFEAGPYPGVVFFVKYVLVGFACMTMATIWGWFLGLLFNPVVAGLSASLSWFIFISTVGNAADFAPVSGPPWVDVHLGPALLRILVIFIFGIAVLARSSSEGLRARVVRSNAVVSACVALVVVVGLEIPLLGQRQPVASPLCIQGEIEYCLWPENEKYASLVREIDARVAQLPAELDLPPVIYDYALSGGLEVRDGVVFTSGIEVAPEFDISEGSRWALARGVAVAIAARVFADCSPAAAPDPELRWDQLQAWLEWRLAGGGLPDYTTNAPDQLQAAWQVGYNAAASLSESDQQAWVVSIVSGYERDHCVA